MKLCVVKQKINAIINEWFYNEWIVEWEGVLMTKWWILRWTNQKAGT